MLISDHLAPFPERLPGSSAAAAMFVTGMLLFGGCASMMSSVASSMADDLSSAIRNNPDVTMVRDGAPAYLILMDSLVLRNPDDAGLLCQAAGLNSSYASAFVDDPERSRLLNAKALGLAERAVCAGLPDGCSVRSRDFDDYLGWLADRGLDDVPLLYCLGSSWAGWIQANSSDFAAIAELSRVKTLMSRIVELDEDYAYGGAHLYLGVFETLFPPAMGGRPEVGRRHFERAIELSGGKQLLAKVLYAKNYARLMFDRPLHDRLLEEVVAADPQVPGLTLTNVIAQRQAKELLETADEYF